MTDFETWLEAAAFEHCHPGVSLMEHEKDIVDERIKFFKSGATQALHSPVVLDLVWALKMAKEDLCSAGCEVVPSYFRALTTYTTATSKANEEKGG